MRQFQSGGMAGSSLKKEIVAEHVRYIKLGHKGLWESECINKGIVRLGFNTQIFVDLLADADWENAFVSHYGSKTQGTITRFINQVRSFFNDDGQTLWITFFKRQMWWTFIDPTQPIKKHDDGYGTFRATISDGWQSKDVNGNPLDMDSLSGMVTKIAGFQGTSCEIRKAEKEYILRRINGEATPSAAVASKLCDELKRVVIEMMRLLTPKDFELLVDLVFTTSGWRRLSTVGGTEKTIDMELVLPTTGEKAFVQVKSKTEQNEFNEEYLEVFREMSQFGRMFYVFHTSMGTDVKCGENNVTIIDAKRLADMVLEAGLVSWLIRKVS